MIRRDHKEHEKKETLARKTYCVMFRRLVFVFLLTSMTAARSAAQEERGLGVKPPKSTASRDVSADPTADQPELILQTGHAQKVDSIAFSPDGKLLVSGSADSTIKIWDLQLGRELRTLSGHTGGVRAVLFGPDGKWIASGGVDGKLKIWDLASGKELKSLDAHSSSVNCLTVSRDGRFLATGGADTLIKIWDVSNWRDLSTLSGTVGWVTALQFSPVDAETLASGGADGTTRLWDVGGGKELREMTGHKKAVRALAFRPDGLTLASGSMDASVRLWQSPKGKKLQTIEGHSGAVLAMSFTPDGARLITGAADHTVRQYNAGGWTEASASGTAENLDLYEAVAFSSDGLYRAASSGDRTIELTRVGDSGARTLASYSNSVLAAAFSADGRWFATGNKDTTIKLWDVRAGREILTLSSNAGSVNAVAFSPSGDLLAAGSLGGAVRLWETASGRSIQVPLNQSGGVNALVFSPDGKRLVVGGGERVVKIWEVGTEQKPRILEGHASDVNALSVSHDGRWLASGAADGVVKIWDIETGRDAQSVSASVGAVNAVAFSPNGQKLATAGADRLLKIWNTTTWRAEIALAGHSAEIFAVAFSRNGETLASAGADKTVRLWDSATGQEKAALNGHSGPIHTLAFSANGFALASGGEDGSVRLWRAAGGALLASVVSMRSSSEWLVVAPNGLFDGSPSAWSQILWRFSNQTTHAAPVEIFFNEFFYPDLLAEILAGKTPRAAQNIAARDRRQPQVKLKWAGATSPGSTPIAERTVTVNIEIEEASPDATHPTGGGARDVRLFRNGSLVKVWHGDVVAPGKRSATLEVVIPIVAGENRLSAYAFNHDNIKSQDEILTIQGAENLKRKGTVYLLAVGINEYANPDFRLNYAVPDAQDFGDELARQQTRLARYEQIEIIPLFNGDAVKTNILAALGRLGRKNEALPAGAPRILEKLKPAEPEDLVMIYFAGHGVADEERFYFVPHDLGYTGKRKELGEVDLQNVFTHSVSDEELSRRLEEIDAGQVVLVIDACQSGQALEAEEKRRGPMNSKGLAQLTYEKGMNILTAAQSYQAALETSRLQHGYLTYALIEDGLKKMEADNAPHDSQVLLREWLDYAAERVPRMQDEKSHAERGLGLKPSGRSEEPKTARTDVQRPRVFYRRELEAQPLVIARSEK
jgi:WD40 repeat protein/uncharacterized caspase-like protein